MYQLSARETCWCLRLPNYLSWDRQDVPKRRQSTNVCCVSEQPKPRYRAAQASNTARYCNTVTYGVHSTSLKMRTVFGFSLQSDRGFDSRSRHQSLCAFTGRLSYLDAWRWSDAGPRRLIIHKKAQRLVAKFNMADSANYWHFVYTRQKLCHPNDRAADWYKHTGNKRLFNLLKTERRPLHLNPQSVPRCKHFSSRL
jgi:hypothetical protein